MAETTTPPVAVPSPGGGLIDALAGLAVVILAVLGLAGLLVETLA